MAKTKQCPQCYGRKTVNVWEEVARSGISVTAERREKICPTCKGTGEVSVTNGDRIRAMSDEELANFLHNVVCKFMCEYCKEYERIKAAKGHANCNGECDKAYLEWLKQPAEEET